jgi:hypothetical protein
MLTQSAVPLMAPVLLLGLALTDAHAQQPTRGPSAAPANAGAKLVFEDDFEGGLGKWRVSDTAHVRVVDSQTSHARVLELVPNGALVNALIPGSGKWSRVAVEGEMLFPDPGHSYLGFMWGYHESDGRSAYANLYVKGNGSYLQVNPHWDDNPVRAMYPEYSADLEGTARIRIGEWKRFRAELVDGTVHFSVGHPPAPQLTCALFGSEPAGELGFRPRVVGARVWIDNIRIRAIDRLSAITERPTREGARDRLLTDWQVRGPLQGAVTSLELGRDQGTRSADWRRFSADSRGAVIAARVLDYLGPRTLAYFRTTISAETAKPLTLRLATLNQAAVWLNGEFLGHVSPVESAWFDIAADASRPHVDLKLPVRTGENILVLRLRGGEYASGGFVAALLD